MTKAGIKPASNEKETSTNKGNSYDANPIVVVLQLFMYGVIASSTSIIVSSSFWLNPFALPSTEFYYFVQVCFSIILDSFLLFCIAGGLVKKTCITSKKPLSFKSCVIKAAKKTWYKSLGLYIVTGFTWYLLDDVVAPQILVPACTYGHTGLSTILFSVSSRTVYLNDTAEGYERKQVKRCGSVVREKASFASSIFKMVPLFTTHVLVFTYYAIQKVLNIPLSSVTASLASASPFVEISN